MQCNCESSKFALSKLYYIPKNHTYRGKMHFPCFRAAVTLFTLAPNHLRNDQLGFERSSRTLSTRIGRNMDAHRSAIPSSAPGGNCFRWELMESENFREKETFNSLSKMDHTRLYFDALRPMTILQAIGAFLVGTLTLTNIQTIPLKMQSYVKMWACMTSIFVSYGAGMVMNDVVDVDLDSQLSSMSTKKMRAIASGKISKRYAWIYTLGLCLSSTFLGSLVGVKYMVWTLSNLVFMLTYALLLQKVLLVKNLICGWLAISPLIGSWLYISSAIPLSIASQVKGLDELIALAIVGFLMHVSREIVKDIEDVDMDRGNKSTLPVVIGENISHKVAYGIVALTYGLNIFTPIYWRIFSSSLPLYPLAITITLPICIKASMMPISKGQRLLKKSIYILLAGMISALLIK